MYTNSQSLCISRLFLRSSRQVRKRKSKGNKEIVKRYFTLWPGLFQISQPKVPKNGNHNISQHSLTETHRYFSLLIISPSFPSICFPAAVFSMQTTACWATQVAQLSRERGKHNRAACSQMWHYPKIKQIFSLKKSQACYISGSK